MNLCEPIKSTELFIYLGSQIANTLKDVELRIAKSCLALDSLRSIWKSSLPDELKRDFFQTSVQSVMLYGAQTWTLTKTLNKKIDGTYTRMLRSALNIHWSNHPTKQQLYGKLPAVSTTIRQSRLRFVGRCWRAKNELACQTVLWKPTHGKANAGRHYTTYIDQLWSDTGCTSEELPTAMTDRK